MEVKPLITDKIHDTLGIIGGMGSMACEYLFNEIIENTYAENDRDHLDIIIVNHASMPDRTEAIIADETDEIVYKLYRDFKFLVQSGADKIVIPCNTSHVFIKKVFAFLKGMDNIIGSEYFLDMIDGVLKNLSGASDVYLWATDGTVMSGVYEERLSDVGVSLHLPEKLEQELVMKVIYDYIKKGKTPLEEDIKILERKVLSGDARSVILGCTELSMLKKTGLLSDEIRYIDPIEIIAKEAITQCGARVK